MHAWPSVSACDSVHLHEGEMVYLSSFYRVKIQNQARLMLPRPLNTRLPQSNRFWREVLGKTANYLPAIPLLKWTYHPLCTQICAYVGMPAYLCIWAELGVYIISAWVCCNYTVKVPMRRQLLRLALRHIPLILLCLFAWQKKNPLCLSLCMLTDGSKVWTHMWVIGASLRHLPISLCLCMH